jgi:hypothetical protein
MLHWDSTIRHPNSKTEETPLLFFKFFGHFWIRICLWFQLTSQADNSISLGTDMDKEEQDAKTALGKYVKIRGLGASTD